MVDVGSTWGRSSRILATGLAASLAPWWAAAARAQTSPMTPIASGHAPLAAPTPQWPAAAVQPGAAGANNAAPTAQWSAPAPAAPPVVAPTSTPTGLSTATAAADSHAIAELQKRVLVLQQQVAGIQQQLQHQQNVDEINRQVQQTAGMTPQQLHTDVFKLEAQIVQLFSAVFHGAPLDMIGP